MKESHLLYHVKYNDEGFVVRLKMFCGLEGKASEFDFAGLRGGGHIVFVESVEDATCAQCRRKYKKEMELPVKYKDLSWTERREVRQQYMKEQGGLCAYCGQDLKKDAPIWIREKRIDWDMFPEGFLEHPVHLDHDHESGLTRGAVHAYCNAVMWQYEGK